MSMITELTPEQEALMYAVRDEYIEKIHTYVEPDLDKVTEWVQWLYKLANLALPEVVVVDNHDEGEALTPVSEVVRDVMGPAVRRGVRQDLDRVIDASVWRNVVQHVGDVIDAVVRKAHSGCSTMGSRYGNYSDLGWVAAQDFYTRIGVLNNEHFNNFKEFCNLGIYDTLQYEGLCVVVKQPLSIKKAHEAKLERLQLRNELIEADRRLEAFVRTHTGGVGVLYGI